MADTDGDDEVVMARDTAVQVVTCWLNGEDDEASDLIAAWSHEPHMLTIALAELAAHVHTTWAGATEGDLIATWDTVTTAGLYKHRSAETDRG